MSSDAAATTPGRPGWPDDLGELRERLRRVVAEKGYRRLPEPVQLASGEWSRDFVDGKAALSDGADLRLACRAMLALAAGRGCEFDAVGGLTMGADQFAHGIAVLSGHRWFVVRKAAKGRGTNQVVEGAGLGPGERVVLIDDVITTGGSIRQAYEQIRAHGAHVVLVTTLLDRGEAARRFFDAQGVVYEPLLTYRDLGIEPIGD